MTSPSAGSLHILYFAWLRERVGLAEEHVVLPDGVRTVARLMVWLASRGDGYAAAFTADNKIRCAVNQEFALPETALKAADGIAFFPPVTGG